MPIEDRHKNVMLLQWTEPVKEVNIRLVTNDVPQLKKNKLIQVFFKG
jgi:hypothetical protein